MNTETTVTRTAHFNRFELEIPAEAITHCSCSGSVDAAVAHYAALTKRPDTCTKHALRQELHEYGAWNKLELRDDAVNWQRIVWIAAGNIAEEERARGKAIGS